MPLYDSILITGGYGMLANALGRALQSRGLSAVMIDRDVLDVTDPAAVDAAFEKYRPSLLLNCAAHTNVDGCEKQRDAADAINGHAAGNLAAASRRWGAALVHYSTDFVFDGSSRRPYRPEDPTSPLSAYGRSKLLGEQKLRENAPERWLILRTAWLYGRPGNCFPRTIVNAAKAGKPLKVVADQTGSPTLTDDLAAATLGLLDRGASGLRHVTNAGQTTWFDFTAAILEEFGLKAELTPTTAAEWARMRPESAARPAYSVLDVEPLAQELGRPMRPWREALRDYRVQVERAGF